MKKKEKIGKLKNKSNLEKKNILKKKEKKQKKRKKGKVNQKKRGKSIVDYCCNPQCFWLWGNSDFPTTNIYDDIIIVN
jgi:hypothetical protein